MREVKFLFKGKTAVVTGAASGIGKAVALMFAKAGANVVVIDFDHDRGRQVRLEAEKLGVRSLFLKADVAVSKDALTVAKAVREYLGQVHVLVNCAGVEFLNSGTILAMSLAKARRIMDVNFWGCVHMARAFAPLMPNGAVIVNLSSIQGIGTHWPPTSYQPSKAAIISLSQGLALALAERGIRAVTVAPGAIKTEGMGAVRASDMASVDPYRIRTPLGRRGWPDEVASAVLFLASDGASYINGTTLIVDGGYKANDTPTHPGMKALVVPHDPDRE